MRIISDLQSSIDNAFNVIDHYYDTPIYNTYHTHMTFPRAWMDVNLCWKDDSSLLMVAAKNGRVKTVQMLIELGADVNGSSNTGNTALMEAARNNHVDVIKMLLQNGADIAARDEDGFTAWKLAVNLNHKEAAAILDKNGLEVIAIARNKAAARQYQTQQYSAVVCVLLVMVLSCAYLFMSPAAAALSSPSLHTTLHNSTTTSVMDNITATMPTNVNATSTNSMTWLGKHLATQGMAADLITLCEDKLVRQEGFGSARTLQSTYPKHFNRAYITSIGITGLGVQQILLDLHTPYPEYSVLDSFDWWSEIDDYPPTQSRTHITNNPTINNVLLDFVYNFLVCSWRYRIVCMDR